MESNGTTLRDPTRGRSARAIPNAGYTPYGIHAGGCNVSAGTVGETVTTRPGVGARIFIFLLVPKTKGKPLEEIEAHWRTGNHPRAL